jgi:hypothetical protein
MHNNDTSLDVNSYTDEELYQLLDLFHPTDRELEQKIYMMMEKYEAVPEMHNFFHDIFKHFFEDADDDNPNQIVVYEGFEQQPDQAATSAPAQDSTQTQPHIGNQTITTAAQPDPTPQSVKQLLYTKGSLNPLLKESIKRIISIDSQFRDLKLYPYSTAFTFNLSEPLRDVVSMKLYSIQVPYTWYTIAEGFGSNFFFIKGNSPGIDNGNFDYQISIQAGNYQAPDFVSYLNNGFAQVFQNTPDVNFGTTGVTYNSINAKLTTIIDIQNIYNEVNYELIFPSSSFTPYVANAPTIYSIPQLLGFSNSTYQPCTTFSNPIPNTRLSSQFRYTVDASNSVFYIYVYQGPETYNPAFATTTANYLFNTITITIPTTNPNTGTSRYSEADLVTMINTQLSANPSIIAANSSLIQQPSSSDPTHSTYQYKLSIVLNRKTIKNAPHVKYAAYFPDSPNNPLWVGAQSFLNLSSNYCEFQSIVSENESEITSYNINYPPTIYLKCNRPYYGQSDTSLNDISLTIPLSPTFPVPGYTMPQYLAAINGQFSALSANTSNAYVCSIDTSNPTSLPTMKFDIHQVFYNNNFWIDVSGSIFDVLMNFPKEITDGTTTTTFDLSSNTTSTFNLENGYAIYDATNPANEGLPCNQITIYSIGENNNLVPPVTVTIPIPGGQTIGFYEDTAALFRAINNAFASVSTSDVYDNSYNNIDMTNSYLSYNINPNGTVTCTFHMDVRCVLTERDYDVILSDPSGHSWSKNLYFMEDTSYSLVSDPVLHYAQIQGSHSVFSNQLYLTTANSYFYLNPVYNAIGGVYTKTGDYNMTIQLTLPLNASYTKEDIVKNINEVLGNNIITQGSYIDISTSNTIIRVDINKIFTAQDYRLVFFDTTSFTKCNFGLPTSVTFDTVLGWVLGYRNSTEYFLSQDYVSTNQTTGGTYYDIYQSQAFTYDPVTKIATITGDTSINVNLYNYVMLIMDDYTQNHLNDGLVTITTTDTDIPLPSYASRNYVCDVNTGQQSIGNIVVDKESGNHLTANQLYAANQILVNQKSKDNLKSSGPFVQDIFGLVPIKTSGLQPGQSYIEFGGTLQNQERVYFGPVNIRRMSIELLNDKGTLLDLNGANWSFSFLVEQLYNPDKG